MVSGVQSCEHDLRVPTVPSYKNTATLFDKCSSTLSHSQAVKIGCVSAD